MDGAEAPIEKATFSANESTLRDQFYFQGDHVTVVLQSDNTVKTTPQRLGIARRLSRMFFSPILGSNKSNSGKALAPVVPRSRVETIRNSTPAIPEAHSSIEDSSSLNSTPIIGLVRDADRQDNASQVEEVVPQAIPARGNHDYLRGFALLAFSETNLQKLGMCDPTTPEIYVGTMLRNSGLGLACWNPRPHELVARGIGVIPGDVGTFSAEGGFKVAFNIWGDAESIQRTASTFTPRTRYNPLPMGNMVNVQDRLQRGEIVKSPGIHGKTQYQENSLEIKNFSMPCCPSPEKGAVLALTSAADQQDLYDHSILREHIMKHCELLYQHYNSLPSLLLGEDESLYIITGCIKSETWGVAAFGDPMTAPDNVLRLENRICSPLPDEKGQPITAWAWTDQGTANTQLSGPSLKGVKDQSLFLRGFSLDFSPEFRSEMKRRALKGSTLESGGSGGGDSDGPGGHSGGGGGGGGGGNSGDNGSGGSGRHGRGSSSRQGGGGPSSSDKSSLRFVGGSSSRSKGNRDGEDYREVKLQTFPDSSRWRSCHPSDIINECLLEATGASFALTHDDDWAPFLGGFSIWESTGTGDTDPPVTTHTPTEHPRKVCVQHGVAHLEPKISAVGHRGGDVADIGFQLGVYKARTDEGQDPEYNSPVSPSDTSSENILKYPGEANTRSISVSSEHKVLVESTPEAHQTPEKLHARVRSHVPFFSPLAAIGIPATLSRNEKFNLQKSNPVNHSSGPAFLQSQSKSFSIIASLEPYISPSALHNSADRCDAPKCFPGTRVAVQEDILRWIRNDDGDPSPSKNIMWVTGPAGAGKTAIAGSIADACEEKGLLAGSFFFSSDSGNASRRTKRDLVPTLAYQLARQLPEAELEIHPVIKDNPPIFEQSIKNQLETLILGPLHEWRRSTQTVQSVLTPKVFIIDGLDECESSEYHEDPRNEYTAAEEHIEVLETLLQAVKDPAFPFRILVFSRPEAAIRRFFSEIGDDSLELFLDDKYDPGSDIALFLESKFSELRRRYNIAASWPTAEVIQFLVESASGQFIYAVTIIRFLEDSREGPKIRLNKFLENCKRIQPTDSAQEFHPLKSLDLLYTSIMRRSSDPGRLAMWLHAINTVKLSDIDNESAFIWTTFLSSYPKDVVMLIEDMPSLMVIPPKGDLDAQFRLYHKSFLGFLVDPRRSLELYVDDEASKNFCTVRFVQILKDKGPAYKLTEEQASFFFKWFTNAIVYHHRFNLQGASTARQAFIQTDLLSCDVYYWMDKICSIFNDPREATLHIVRWYNMFHQASESPCNWLRCHRVCKYWRSRIEHFAKGDEAPRGLLKELKVQPKWGKGIISASFAQGTSV